MNDYHPTKIYTFIQVAIQDLNFTYLSRFLIRKAYIA